ncbi:GET complex subunit GET2 domain-containing protein [Hirsutella rhossiliensis]|uniref:GET complex subunit GET2 domain-containing protein n=1 Tax=Hirsutella rhossiliensis TaxID=111463 RepID=A0A9P8N3M5_9HYPO|nr:GET complex subunit GET2 domain-containing protein [Hirsutella rhossiliensis]KAH0967048.1 GET complex subunit GET2 domain-containing protein [Hirsutella rhossiliensis]
MAEPQDAAAATSSSSDAAAQRAAEQARLRKERREAKIKAGGSARLNKITGIGGRVVGDSTEQATPLVSSSPPPAADAPPRPDAADPDEVDISEHCYAPKNASPSPVPGSEQAVSDAQLRQMMLGFDRPGPGPRGSPGPGLGPGFAAPGPGAADGEDQLIQMMSQLMGGFAPGSGSSPSAASPFPGMPSLGQFQQQQQQQQQPARPDGYTYMFRLLHALLALGLGLYVALLTPFAGTRAEREHASLAHAQHTPADDANEHRKRIFFWIFATGEALLLSSRFFLDKGRRPPAGMLWTVIGFLPEPLRGYVTVGLKYGQIFTTVRADILACMFVLGVCSWWKT